MSINRDGIVIVGGGLAGQRCAETLRRLGSQDPIRIVCGEGHPPYDRPPLSKQILTGDVQDSAVILRPMDWYERESVELFLGVQATALAPAQRRVELSDGRSLRYDKLLIATGSRPRTLPMLTGYPNVSALRTLEESQSLRDVLRHGPRLAVLGAGFIGQEVAAAARKLGVEVTMIEAAPAPLINVLGSRLGSWFTELHRAEGVEVITASTVERVSANGAVNSLHLSTGQSVPVDHVVVGVGAEPDIAWLAGSNLEGSQGVAADAHGRTAIADVFAVGDAAASFD